MLSHGRGEKDGGAPLVDCQNLRGSLGGWGARRWDMKVGEAENTYW